jgi:transposase
MARPPEEPHLATGEGLAPYVTADPRRLRVSKVTAGDPVTVLSGKAWPLLDPGGRRQRHHLRGRPRRLPRWVDRHRPHAKVSARRQDTARKGAKHVHRDLDHLAVEDFRPKFLAKSTMARKAAGAAIGATKRALLEMTASHGRTVHLVDPDHTTMGCSNCRATAKTRLLLAERTYTCGSCGTVRPRDKNSAALMLIRPGLHPAGADQVSLLVPIR